MHVMNSWFIQQICCSAAWYHNAVNPAPNWENLECLQSIQRKTKKNKQIPILYTSSEKSTSRRSLTALSCLACFKDMCLLSFKPNIILRGLGGAPAKPLYVSLIPNIGWRLWFHFLYQRKSIQILPVLTVCFLFNIKSGRSWWKCSSSKATPLALVVFSRNWGTGKAIPLVNNRLITMGKSPCLVDCCK